LLGAGPHRIFVSLDFSPNRRGGVAVTPSADPGRNLQIKEFFDVVSGVGTANVYRITAVGARHDRDARRRYCERQAAWLSLVGHLDPLSL
jgi:hypothetical protein